MVKGRRPRVILRCVADKYVNKTKERTIEFDGGLINFCRMDSGRLMVTLYRLDDNVVVNVASKHLREEAS